MFLLWLMSRFLSRVWSLVSESNDAYIIPLVYVKPSCCYFCLAHVHGSIFAVVVVPCARNLHHVLSSCWRWSDCLHCLHSVHHSDKICFYYLCLFWCHLLYVPSIVCSRFVLSMWSIIICMLLTYVSITETNIDACFWNEWGGKLYFYFAQPGKSNVWEQGVTRLHRMAGVIIIISNDIEHVHQYMCYSYVCTLFSQAHLCFWIPSFREDMFVVTQKIFHETLLTPIILKKSY
jgi:hypothetical protein